MDISTRWRNAPCPSSNATMVQRQLSIIHRQGSLPSKQSRFKSLDYSIWNELAHAVNWDKITSKNTLIIKRLERFVNKLSLKVVRLGLIDSITYLKMMEIIFDNKNNVFCRAFNGEYFEKKFNSLG